jgi:hypothetical protein
VDRRYWEIRRTGSKRRGRNGDGASLAPEVDMRTCHFCAGPCEQSEPASLHAGETASALYAPPLFRLAARFAFGGSGIISSMSCSGISSARQRISILATVG